MSASDRRREDRLSGAPAEGERHPGFRAVGAAGARLVVPIVGKKDGVLARLKAEWGAVVGPEWSELCWPIAFGRDGVLRLRVASQAALELQHAAPLLIERLNGFLGRPAVSRLALLQGPLPLPPPSPAPPPILCEAVQQRRLDGQLAGVADPELRAALARLGRAVIGTR